MHLKGIDPAFLLAQRVRMALPSPFMNKTQLVDALAARIGDRRTAATAVDGLLETIVATVGSGESVSLTGFGVFEPRARAARVARNPRTGATVEVPATTAPAFRPGAGFRSAVGGSSPSARRAPARAAVPAAAAPVATAAKAPAAKAPAAGRVKAGKSFAAEPDAGTAKPTKKAAKGAAAKNGKAQDAKKAKAKKK